VPPLTPFSRPRGLRPFVDVNRSLRSRMFDTKESLTASERSERAGQGGPEGADAVLLAELLPASEHDGTGGPAGNRANPGDEANERSKRSVCILDISPNSSRWGTKAKVRNRSRPLIHGSISTDVLLLVILRF